MSEITTQEDAFAAYDIIGDVHGCYQPLIELIELLGYTKQGGLYRYRDQRKPHQLVFLGDIIDRGPQIRETLLLVQELVEHGLAVMIMGNHEHSAVAYHTPKHNQPGEYLRSHKPRHQQQIAATLEQFSNTPEDWCHALQWMQALPLFMQWPHFRIVHACWDKDIIEQYWQQYQQAGLTAEFLQQAAETGSFAQTFMDRLTRGVDLPLPGGEFITGRDGLSRSRFRVKFWPSSKHCYKDIAFQPDPLPEHIARQALSEGLLEGLPCYEPDEVPLFVGHYWCTGTPEPISSNIACLDYSAVSNGKLVAYRMSGSMALDAKRFVWVDMPSQG